MKDAWRIVPRLLQLAKTKQLTRFTQESLNYLQRFIAIVTKYMSPIKDQKWGRRQNDSRGVRRQTPRLKLPNSIGVFVTILFLMVKASS